MKGGREGERTRMREVRREGGREGGRKTASQKNKVMDQFDFSDAL